ncbi:MAG: V-type ATP synthase subunit I [Clostridiales bacterium]|nr:V-type ATP synthase subunit I [Clostridiales bacterium]
MAIVEMKKVRLLALRRDRSRVFRSMQRLGCVHILDGGECAPEEFKPRDLHRLEEAERQIARLDWAVSKIAPFAPEKKGLFSLKPEKTEDDLLAAQAGKADVMEIVSRLEEIERTLSDLRSKEARERAELQKLKPWAPLDAPFERIGAAKNSRSLLVSVQPRDWPALEKGAKELSVEPVLIEISRDRDGVYALIAAHLSDSEALSDLLRLTGAVEVSFPGARGTAAATIEQLEGRIKRIAEVRAQLRKEVEHFGRRTGEVKVYRDALALERSQLEAASKVAETGSAFFLTGWTPADCVERVRAAIERSAADFELEFLDPAEDEDPPTLLRNNKFLTPFESIVKLYALPNPRGIDPTLVMTPFFICFFGLMMGDAAYGIIMAVIAALITWKLRGRGGMGAIVAVLVSGSVSTIVWGALLGGWFGIEDVKPLIGFTPMGEPIKMMILCLGLGAVQLLTGIGVAMYMNFRRRQVLDGLLDQGLWFVLFGGIGMLFVNPQIGKILAIVGAAGIFLTAGRKRKKLLSKFTGGFGALYGISGYISDLLSYARLFGMGLATGVIAMVMNNVAGMLMGGGVVGFILGAVVLVVGHTFNIAINVLGAYVHTCRLQYIEFFGKFFEDGGKPFTPLGTEGKYVDFGLDRAA